MVKLRNLKNNDFCQTMMTKTSNWLEDECDLQMMFDSLKGTPIHNKIVKMCPRDEFLRIEKFKEYLL